MKAKQCSFEGCTYIGTLWSAKPQLCKTHALFVKAQNKPKVGDIYQEKEISIDSSGAEYHKEFRIVSVTPSKTTKVYSSDKGHVARPKTTPKEDKSLPELIKLAVTVFHRWIKERDRNGDYFTCISCGEVKHISVANAGHFRNGTVTELKFNPDNVHLEDETCNCHNPNHLIGYRKNLIKKIGIEKVVELESVPLAKYYKYEREELYDIINRYK